MTDGDYTRTEAWNLQLQGEIDSLRAENAELLAALAKITQHLSEWIDEYGPTPDDTELEDIATARALIARLDTPASEGEET